MSIKVKGLSFSYGAHRVLHDIGFEVPDATLTVVLGPNGVGKTTTCVNLTAALKQQGRRVLLCDFDPQANATSGMGVDKTVSNGVYDVLINGVEPRKAVVHTPYADVLPSSKALAGAGIEMTMLNDRQFLLKNEIAFEEQI